MQRNQFLHLVDWRLKSCHEIDGLVNFHLVLATQNSSGVLVLISSIKLRVVFHFFQSVSGVKKLVKRHVGLITLAHYRR